MSGVRINELPKFLAKDPNENKHAIIFNEPLKLNQPLIIMLVLNGVTRYFPSRKTISSEYEDELIPYIDMTSEVTV